VCVGGFECVREKSKKMLRRTQAFQITSFNVQPKLSSAFNNKVIVAPKAVKEVAAPASAQITELANGVRIISQDFGEPMAAVGVYNCAAGAKYDPCDKPGLNYVMRCALMLSSMSDSMFQFDRAVRSIGASFEHQEIRKQYLGWRVESRRDMIQKPLGMMLSCVAAPRFLDVEVDRYRDLMDAVTEEQRWKTPRDHVVEQLEQIAFYKETCGKPRYVPPQSNDDCSSKSLIDQWCATFLPKNIIVAGVNVAHTDLITAYENGEFPHSAKAPHFRQAIEGGMPSSEAAQYQGGRESSLPEKRYKEMSTKPHMNNETIAGIGWLAAGTANLKDYATALVLQQMVDVVAEDGIRCISTELDNGIRTFYSAYQTAGLMGVTTRSDPQTAKETFTAALSLFRRSTQQEINLKRAAQRAVLRFYHESIELRRDYLDFLASSIGVSGATQERTKESVVAAIRAVTFQDVKAALDSSLAIEPCLYVTGDGGIPSLKQLGLKK